MLLSGGLRRCLSVELQGLCHGVLQTPGQHVHVLHPDKEDQFGSDQRVGDQIWATMFEIVTSVALNLTFKLLQFVFMSILLDIEHSQVQFRFT